MSATSTTGSANPSGVRFWFLVRLVLFTLVSNVISIEMMFLSLNSNTTDATSGKKNCILPGHRSSRISYVCCSQISSFSRSRILVQCFMDHCLFLLSVLYGYCLFGIFKHLLQTGNDHDEDISIP